MAAQGGQAGADAGQAQQGEAQGQQDGANDALLQQLSSLPDSLAETQQMVRDMAQQFQSQQGQQQTGEPETAPLDVDLSFLDAESPAYDPEAAQQQFAQQIQQLVEQGVQQHVAPIQQAQTEQRIQWETQQLLNEFPELNETETAKQVIGTARDYASALAPAIGLSEQQAQQLANEPGFIRLMYAAGRAFDAASQESDDSQAAHLEGGGGATPGAGQQVDLASLIASGGSDRASGGTLFG